MGCAGIEPHREIARADTLNGLGDVGQIRADLQIDATRQVQRQQQASDGQIATPRADAGADVTAVASQFAHDQEH